jgi:hypothetical protein
MRLPTTISSHPRTVQTYRDNTESASMATVRLHVYQMQALRATGVSDSRPQEVRYRRLDLSRVRRKSKGE